MFIYIGGAGGGEGQQGQITKAQFYSEEESLRALSWLQTRAGRGFRRGGSRLLDGGGGAGAVS